MGEIAKLSTKSPTLYFKLMAKLNITNSFSEYELANNFLTQV